MDAIALLVAVLTLAAGLAIGLLVGRRRAEDAARALVAGAEAAGRQAVAAAEAAGREAVAAAQARTHRAQEEAVRLGATLDSERAAGEVAARERRHAEAQAEARLREAFDSLAGEALRRNNEAFAELAAARLSTADRELATRQQAIEQLLTPVRESLDRVQTHVSTVERERAGAHAALLEQIGLVRETSDRLRLDTVALVTALRAPQVRGRWGEMQLERAVEAAGMTEHVDFDRQASTAGPDGTVRPDLVVRLVGGKNVVVDSKVAFSAYLEAMEATDEATRDARFKAHARHLRTHVDQLGAKAYFEHFTPSPEFVVCFVPADAFLDAALRSDPALQEHAFDQNVVLATPSTLVAMLRTIAYSWRQEALAANAAEVHKLGRELYARLSTLGGHIDKLGRSLNTAVGDYNKAVSSIESRVLVTARRMVDLKVVDPADTLDPPRQVNEVTRSAQAPELVEQRLVALPKKPAGPAPGQDELPSTASGTP